MSHEDIRRSLEVLDSVLAEFEDSWNSPYSLFNSADLPGFDASKPHRISEEETETVCEGRHITPSQGFRSQRVSEDGSTSHKSFSATDEQPKTCSPPPIPKRSPGTRLSERNIFTFSSDNVSLDSYDSARSDIALSPCLPAHLEDDDVFEGTALDRRCFCVACGRLLRAMEDDPVANEIRCDCQQRLAALQARFADTRLLLLTKAIKQLEAQPPLFRPPPPPRQASKTSLCQSRSSLVCENCSKCVAETIEDLPKLLPTDALNRPQLGLSYTMEEDMPPGVKEILTSTPKSEVSAAAKEMSSLSTFSQSINSLGYVSSQSDLELNLTTPERFDMVPVTSLKSQTLPFGLKLTPSPFYSSTDKSHDSGLHQISGEEGFNRRNTLSGELELRSSSAPPIPQQAEKVKKKHLRVFSKREKKMRKNEDNLSVKSDLSLDEGIILKKIEALDGSTDIYSSSVDRSEGSQEEKPKKRSVWKSILRRK